jgi:hypothetical protein
MQSHLIKIGADGAQLPNDAKNHVAVLDTRTDLMWPAHDVYDGSLRWKEIHKPCEDLVLAGFNDWRPATVEEAFLFCDRTRFNPAFDPEFFPGLKPSWYWTGTVDAEAPSSYAWYVHLSYGYAYLNYQYGSGRVLACRRAARASQ